ARDHVVDAIRIAVGVRDRDDRNAELARFAHRDRLVIGIDHEHRLRELAHSLETADVLLEARALLLELHDLFLRELLVGAVLAHALERTQAIEAALDGAEVGERSTEPAIRDEEHAGATRLFLDDLLRLALRAHEEHRAATTDGIDDEVEGALEEARGLVEIDDVDPAARAVDERTHLRVPALRLVAEVDAGLEEVFDGERLRGIPEGSGRSRLGLGGGNGFLGGAGHFCALGGFSHARCSFRLVPPPRVGLTLLSARHRTRTLRVGRAIWGRLFSLQPRARQGGASARF